LTASISPSAFKSLKGSHIDDLVSSCCRSNRAKRVEFDQFHRYTYDELLARDEVSLDIFGLKDDSHEDLDNLPDPATLAAEIVEDLEAALAEFAEIASSLHRLERRGNRDHRCDRACACHSRTWTHPWVVGPG
jgi:type I restriction enzyme M protein